MAAPAPESDFQFDAETGTITGYIGPGGIVRRGGSGLYRGQRI